jgi:hypothetical protein
MPRVSRCNPACDGSDEEPQKSEPKKGSSHAVKHTTTKGAASTTMHPVTTKSVNAKGNEIEIAGKPNKRGKQIVFSPKTRKSPQGAGTSTSQDDEPAQLQTHTPPPKCLGTLLAIKDRSIVEYLRKRKAPPNTRASGDDGMGGAYSKEQGGPGDGIVVDNLMAAAASC